MVRESGEAHGGKVCLAADLLLEEYGELIHGRGNYNNYGENEIDDYWTCPLPSGLLGIGLRRWSWYPKRLRRIPLRRFGLGGGAGQANDNRKAFL